MKEGQIFNVATVPLISHSISEEVNMVGQSHNPHSDKISTVSSAMYVFEMVVTHKYFCVVIVFPVARIVEITCPFLP